MPPEELVDLAIPEQRRRFWEMAFCAAYSHTDGHSHADDSAAAAKCADFALYQWEDRWNPKGGTDAA